MQEPFVLIQALVHFNTSTYNFTSVFLAVWETFFSLFLHLSKPTCSLYDLSTFWEELAHTFNHSAQGPRRQAGHGESALLRPVSYSWLSLQDLQSQEPCEAQSARRQPGHSPSCPRQASVQINRMLWSERRMVWSAGPTVCNCRCLSCNTCNLGTFRPGDFSFWQCMCVCVCVFYFLGRWHVWGLLYMKNWFDKKRRKLFFNVWTNKIPFYLTLEYTFRGFVYLLGIFFPAFSQVSIDEADHVAFLFSSQKSCINKFNCIYVCK